MPFLAQVEIELGCCGTLLVLLFAGAWVVRSRRVRRESEREAERRQAVARSFERAKEDAAEKARIAAGPKRCRHTDCQHENKPGASFCGQCGRFMDGLRNA